jgi:hypothetical protein
MSPLRLHVISCPVFRRELEVLEEQLQTGATFAYLDMGLHEGAAGNLRDALQRTIDETDTNGRDVIALGYGLCNRGIVGLRSRVLPMIIPRAHDCIGMLLGGTQCYLAQLETQPGTYFQSAGWLENLPVNRALLAQNLPLAPGVAVTRAELAARYGEENADYLLEQFADFTRHYQRLAFITTPVPKANEWEAAARRMANDKGWKFERVPGDLGWLRRLLSGDWDDREFLTLRPGQRVGLRTDSQLIEPEPENA